MNKSVAILVVLLVLQCGVNGIAMAQAQSNPCSKTSDIAFAGPHPIGWDCVGWGIPTGLAFCTFPTCPPPPPPPGSCPACGSPVSLATGNTYIDQTDLRIPGLSNGLNLVRRWNSRWPPTLMATQVGLLDEIGVRPTRSESLPMVTATCYTLMVTAIFGRSLSAVRDGWSSHQEMRARL